MAILGKVVGGMGLGLVALVGYGLYLEWDVARWDRKIDALCAADGGSGVAPQVYETALIPETKEYFADTKPIRSVRIPTQRAEQTLGPRYPYVLQTARLETLNSSNPTVYKYVVRIVRVADNKVLGEQFDYVRTGGGVPFPDPSTPHSCSDRTQSLALDVAVFLNHPKRATGVSK